MQVQNHMGHKIKNGPKLEFLVMSTESRFQGVWVKAAGIWGLRVSGGQGLGSGVWGSGLGGRVWDAALLKP